MILAVYGYGGAGREVREIATKYGSWEEIIFIDDATTVDTFQGARCMTFDTFRNSIDTDQAQVIIAMGEPRLKYILYNKVTEAGYELANVIHPKAIISDSAKLGKGLIIKPGVVISVNTVVEDNVTLEEYAIVGHDTVVHAHAQIAAFVMISGGCTIGERVYIAIHVPVREGITIGDRSVVGMGSAVMRDIPEDVTAMGNPARVIQKRTEKDRVFHG